MDSVRKMSAAVSDAIKGSSKSESGSEPPSGITGQGTADKPYDQGNAPENASSGEPVSGEQGKGTIDEPFDKGNTGGELSIL